MFFGIISIAVGLLTLVLPETLNKPLPQTLEDVDRLGGKAVGPSTPSVVPVEAMALQENKAEANGQSVEK